MCIRDSPSVGCYAVCGTEIPYAATRCAVLSARMLLGACFAMSGTDLAYGARRRARRGPYPWTR
eukprot:1120188-Rhodomonas_salina.1